MLGHQYSFFNLIVVVGIEIDWVVTKKL